jgi:hypothetical protein
MPDKSVLSAISRSPLVKLAKDELAGYVAGKPFQRIQPEARAGIKATGKFVQEHPAETAVGVLSAPIMPATLAGALGTGALLAGGRVIDKTHPLTDDLSDFETMTPLDNTVDIAGNAVGGAALHYGGGRLAKYLDGAEVLPVRGAGLASRGLASTEMPTMATGIRYPSAVVDATLTPLERNQVVVRQLASIPGDPPQAPLMETQAIKGHFRDYIAPPVDKFVRFYAEPLPKGTAFRMPLGSFNASSSTRVSPARLLDQAFIR